jgi:perosamine synthetase
MNIPLSRPDITEREIDAVVSVLRSPHLSLGPKLVEFEEAFASYIGVPHAVALSSGTAGMHLGLLTLGVGEGYEVILPSFTFIAAANVVLYQRATPVFADVDPVTLNLTAESIERAITPRTRAIILVHTFGYPADLGAILELAERYNLRVIEDACESIGAEYRGARVGGFGDLGVFSFYPNKPITTGEGGVLVTRDKEIARQVRALRNQGRLENDGWLEHSLLGYNYRIPDINCALGMVQLSRIDEILAKREEVARYYCDALQGYPEVAPPPMTAANGRISWFAFIVRLPGSAKRVEVMRTLANHEIDSRPYFPPIHLQPLYSRYGGKLPVTEDMANRTLALPFFNTLKREEVGQVCAVLGAALQNVEQTARVLGAANQSGFVIDGENAFDQ